MNGARRHPTESLGVPAGSLGGHPKTFTVSNKPLPEINTIHAFGPQGNETPGWPYQATARIGTAIGGGRFYTPPRLSQGELGNGSTTKRPRRRKARR